jgi:hypothetical protein
MAEQSDLRTLTMQQVADIFCVSTYTIREWLQAGWFPPPLAVSPHKKLWRYRDIERLLDSQVPLDKIGQQPPKQIVAVVESHPLDG